MNPPSLHPSSSNTHSLHEIRPPPRRSLQIPVQAPVSRALIPLVLRPLPWSPRAMRPAIPALSRRFRPVATSSLLLLLHLDNRSELFVFVLLRSTSSSCGPRAGAGCPHSSSSSSSSDPSASADVADDRLVASVAVHCRRRRGARCAVVFVSCATTSDDTPPRVASIRGGIKPTPRLIILAVPGTIFTTAHGSYGAEVANDDWDGGAQDADCFFCGCPRREGGVGPGDVAGCQGFVRDDGLDCAAGHGATRRESQRICWKPAVRRRDVVVHIHQT